MKEFLFKYYKVILMMITWAVFPVYAGKVGSMVVVSISILLLMFSNAKLELLLGFFFILILSDNLNEVYNFAKSYKNVYIVLLAIIVLANYSENRPKNSILVKFIPFFLVATIALMFSGDISIGIQKTISYILLLIITPSLLLQIYKEEGSIIFKDIIFFLLLVIIASFIVGFFNHDFAYIKGQRLRGFFGNPNGLGIFLFLVFMFYLLSVDFYPSVFNKSERMFIITVILMALFFTGSRSALFSILIIVIFHRLQNNSPFLGLIVFSLIVVSYEAITSNMVVIVKSLGVEDYFRVNTLEEGSGRYIAWGVAWHKIQDFFYIGGGFGNDEFIMRKNYRVLSFLGHQGGVHNSYLTFWFDAGIIGLVLYFRAFILLFIEGAKRRSYAIPCLYSVLFSITYESWLAGSLNPFTIILFLSISLLFHEEFVPQKKELLIQYEK